MQDNRLWKLLIAPHPAMEQPSNNDWSEIENRYRSLPVDFRTFVTEYGTGIIGRFIWIFNPASNNEHLNLGCQIDMQLAALREARIPGLTLYPAESGILPFGSTDNGDLLAWQVQGEPDSWRVVVIDSRAPIFQTFEVGFSQFLVGIFERELICDIFPDDFPCEHPIFSPI
ncbi:SMI1/KNR4 family protein [bacterium]|nr:SMI1/KNR4 family protein [bacterium]